MGTFQVELKKVVDDSYEIEVGFALEDKLIQDWLERFINLPL